MGRLRLRHRLTTIRTQATEANRVPRVRRRAWLLFFCHDGTTLDIEQLLSGTLASAPLSRLYAVSPASGMERPITRDELDVLLAVSSAEWTDTDGFDSEVVGALVESDLLVKDEREDFDERLRDSGWNIYAAVYHFLTRWRDVDVRPGEGELLPANDEGVREFLALYGTQPPPFRALDGPAAVVDLPPAHTDGGLYSALAERRTTRSFHASQPLALDELGLALHQVFGCHGFATSPGGEIVNLKRTSPSAGGLHPIEAFPLLTNVAGVEPGIYHYDAERHALSLLTPLERDAATALATQFVCGQTYFGSVHALFLLVARFVRSNWKYRRHQKAYASVLLDAGHLSQTLYLVAADRGLGAFVTGVINNAEIDERLGLDGIDEGAVAVCGLGIPGAVSPFDPVFRPLR
jgi:putative peptide maturation dehydrogenase